MMPSSRGIWEVWEARSWQNFAVSVDATSQTITMTVAWKFLMQTSSTPVREDLGCGCSAVTLASYYLPRVISGKWKRILFIPTGALLSPVSFNEGNSVPGIAHGVVIEHEEVA